jgi:hypothetical protein
MEPVAVTIYNYAGRCYTSEGDFDYETLSPYIMLSIYQAAVVYLHLQRLSDEPKYASGLERLQTVLKNFARRWAAASMLPLITITRSSADRA